MERNYLLSEKDAARLQRALRFTERLQGKLINTVRRRRGITAGTTTGGGIKRARCQGAANATTGTVSVMLADSAGAVSGSAFNVYLLPAKSTSLTLANYLNVPVLNTLVLIAQDQSGDWYLIDPQLILKSAISGLFSTVTTSVYTGIQVNGAAHTLEGKTTTITVLDVGSTTGWTTLHTGTVCPEP